MDHPVFPLLVLQREGKNRGSNKKKRGKKKSTNIVPKPSTRDAFVHRDGLCASDEGTGKTDSLAWLLLGGVVKGGERRKKLWEG